MRKISFRKEVCMGCGLCEVYCLVQHSRSKDIVKAYKREVPQPLSRVRVEVKAPSSLAVQCLHCHDPPCVRACLSGAMEQDNATGLITHNVEKCVGCWTCIIVCPYGAIAMDAVNRRVVAKCDLCAELAVPACVANCPNEALVCHEVTPFV